ncbi:DeoR family transcriptional regulator [Streptomyces cinereoruber]|uniref:DeoR family transcriptional regulator n=1 Tax=Streptomyces cinereoruber TaxID=67260 RepID=UPI00363CE252
MADPGALLADQRRRFILERVRRDGAVRVTELVEHLVVSHVAIRRSLDVLARRGILEKDHGGVVALTGAAGYESAFESESAREPAEKKSIAQAAAERVGADDVVRSACRFEFI